MSRKSSTETIVAAMRILARDIHSGDGVANAAIAEAADRLEEQQARIVELEAKAAIGRRAVDCDALTDKIAEALGGTYHCTRVWEAWSYGTMTQDDFCDVGESETPGEIADMVITLLRDAEQAAPEPATVAVDAGALAELRADISKLDELNDRESRGEYVYSRSWARSCVIESARRLLAGGE
jgi:hypothetical protein